MTPTHCYGSELLLIIMLVLTDTEFIYDHKISKQLSIYLLLHKCLAKFQKLMGYLFLAATDDIIISKG